MKRQIEQFKRTLAGLLAAAMVLTMAPEAVFADELPVATEEAIVETTDEEVVADEAVDVVEEVEDVQEITEADTVEEETVEVQEEAVVEETVEAEPAEKTEFDVTVAKAIRGVTVLSENGDAKLPKAKKDQDFVFILSENNVDKTQVVVTAKKKSSGFPVEVHMGEGHENYVHPYSVEAFAFDSSCQTYYWIECSDIDDDIVLEIVEVGLVRWIDFTDGDSNDTYIVATDKNYDNVVSGTLEVTSDKNLEVYIKPDKGNKLSVKANYTSGKKDGEPVKFVEGLSTNNVDGSKYVVAKEDLIGDVQFIITAEGKDATATVKANGATVTVNGEAPDKNGEVAIKTGEVVAIEAALSGNTIPYEINYTVNNGVLVTKDTISYSIDASDVTGDVNIEVLTYRKLTVEAGSDDFKITGITSIDEGTAVTNEYDVPVGEVSSVNIKYLSSYTNGIKITTEPIMIGLDGGKKSVAESIVANQVVSVNGVAKDSLKTDKTGSLVYKMGDEDESIKINSTPVQNAFFVVNGDAISSKTITVSSGDVVKLYNYLGSELPGFAFRQSENVTYTENGGVVGTAAIEPGKSGTITFDVNGKETTFTIKKQSAATSIAISGVKQNATSKAYEATPQAGTKFTAAISVKPSGADVSNLVLSANDGTELGRGQGAIDFFKDMSVNVGDDLTYTLSLEGVANSVQTINIKADTTALEAAKPTVELNYAGATRLALNIKLPKSLAKVDTSTLKYVVSVNGAPREDSLSVAGDSTSYTVTGLSVNSVNKISVFVKQGTVVSKVPTEVEYKTAGYDAYETKLGIKKGTTTVFQGQTNVTLGTAKWSKTTSEREIAVVRDDYDEIVFTCTTGSIVADIPATATPGKHIITVVAAAADNTVPSVATITVNVKREIKFGDNVNTDLTTGNVYKAPGKAANLSVKFNYHPDKKYAPASKAYTYKILNEDDSAYNGNDITVKNGKVVVNKNYVVKSKTGDTYKVRVIAGDIAKAKGREVDPETLATRHVDLSFTITAKAANIAEVKLADYDDDLEEYVNIMSLSDTKTYQLRDVAKKRILAYDNKGNLIKDVTFKPSNKSLIVLDIINDNVKPGSYKITATANDGSKSKKVVKLNIGYSTKKVFTEIYDDNYDPYVPTTALAGSNKGVKGTNTNLTTEGFVVLVGGYGDAINVKVSAKGGTLKKIWITSSYQEYKVIPTAAQTLITVTNKLNKSDAVTYTIVNDKFTSVKAPKVKSIITTNGGKLYNWSKVEQKIVLSGNKAGETLPLSVNTVKVYNKDGNDIGASVVDHCAIITIPDHYYAGDYSGKYTVELLDGDKPVCKPFTISIKVNKNPASSYKLASSVTEGTDVTTGAKAKYATLKSVDGLKAANINGKKNAFLEYFELSGNKIVLKAGKEFPTDKNDCIGYVVCTVDDTIMDKTYDVTAKIAVKAAK